MRRILCVALVVSTLWAMPALATTQSASMDVTATFRVPTSVTLMSASTMDFGIYHSGQASDADATSVVTILSFPLNRTFSIFTDMGQHPANGWRSMVNNTDIHLQYALYKDPGRLQEVPTEAGGWILDTTGGGSSVTLYGRIPHSQFPLESPYLDSVTVTVEYTP